MSDSQDERAGRHVEVRLPVVDLDPRRIDVVAQPEVHGQLVAEAEVVLDVHRDLRPLLGVGDRVEQVAVLGVHETEHEARHVESGRAVDRAAGRLAGAVRRHVVVEAEVADDRVGVEDFPRSKRQAAAHLQRVLAAAPGDVVEDLEVVLVGDERLVAVGAQVADVLEGELRHRRRRVD